MPSETRRISPCYVYDMNHLRFIESEHRVYPCAGARPSARTFAYNALPRRVHAGTYRRAVPWIRLLKIKIHSEYTGGILKCKINRDKTCAIFMRIFKIPTEKYDVRRKENLLCERCVLCVRSIRYDIQYTCTLGSCAQASILDVCTIALRNIITT